MNQAGSRAELRIRAAKYRAMARLTTDQETARRIQDLAEELEGQAREMQAQDARSPHCPN